MKSGRMAVRRWVFQTLKADTGEGNLIDLLRKGETKRIDGKPVSPNKVFQNRAADDAAFPFVVIQSVPGGDDTNSLGNKRVTSELFFQVAVESEDGTRFDEEGVVNRIDDLLHGVLKEDVFPRFSSRREREADENTFGSALSTRMAGGVYRFLVNGEK